MAAAAQNLEVKRGKENIVINDQLLTAIQNIVYKGITNAGDFILSLEFMRKFMAQEDFFNSINSDNENKENAELSETAKKELQYKRYFQDLQNKVYALFEKGMPTWFAERFNECIKSISGFLLSSQQMSFLFGMFLENCTRNVLIPIQQDNEPREVYLARVKGYHDKLLCILQDHKFSLMKEDCDLELYLIMFFGSDRIGNSEEISESIRKLFEISAEKMQKLLVAFLKNVRVNGIQQKQLIHTYVTPTCLNFLKRILELSNLNLLDNNAALSAALSAVHPKIFDELWRYGANPFLEVDTIYNRPKYQSPTRLAFWSNLMLHACEDYQATGLYYIPGTMDKPDQLCFTPEDTPAHALPHIIFRGTIYTPEGAERGVDNLFISMAEACRIGAVMGKPETRLINRNLLETSKMLFNQVPITIKLHKDFMSLVVNVEGEDAILRTGVFAVKILYDFLAWHLKKNQKPGEAAIPHETILAALNKFIESEIVLLGIEQSDGTRRDIFSIKELVELMSSRTNPEEMAFFLEMANRVCAPTVNPEMFDSKLRNEMKVMQEQITQNFEKALQSENTNPMSLIRRFLHHPLAAIIIEYAYGKTLAQFISASPFAKPAVSDQPRSVESNIEAAGSVRSMQVVQMNSRASESHHEDEEPELRIHREPNSRVTLAQAAQRPPLTFQWSSLTVHLPSNMPEFLARDWKPRRDKR